MVLKATANERRHLALCHDESRVGLDLAFADQMALVTTNRPAVQRRPMHVIYVEAQTSSLWCGIQKKEEKILYRFEINPFSCPSRIQNDLCSRDVFRHGSTRPGAQSLDHNGVFVSFSTQP
ncbi:hypothetical protein TNCV_5056991 [Trichonephila clavipes]|nr:hypothetical protein TNCV_5056991 [Trichonephila clavipes]